MAGEVVLVTGGNGFVGQHVVKLLHQYCQNEVKEIRIFDIRPFANRLDYSPVIPEKSIVGDICSLSSLSSALQGVDCVIHIAGYISIGTYPETQRMKAINVDGTNLVIEACILNNITRLVYTSSVDAVSPLRDCLHVNEEDLPYPDPSELAMPEYATTKQQAEKLVVGSHRKPLSNGTGKLQTVCLRPTGMFGELDVTLVAHLVQRAGRSRGVAVTVAPRGQQAAIHDVTYVGNVAWAHICGMRALRDHSDMCGGKAFFITDDTPRQIMFEHSRPFMEARGYRMAKYKIPYIVAYLLILFLQTIFTLLKPIKKINLPVNLKILDYINYSYYFKRDNIEKYLDYKPLFSYEEAVKQSMPYYKTMKI